MADREKDIGRFDKWSTSYEESWMQKALFDRAHRATLELATSMVHDPTYILDIGCGTGRLLRRAHTYWPEAQLIGVDPAKGMIEAAQRLTPYATFYQGMGEALPLTDGSVDLAFSTVSFHHWQDQAAGVLEVARVLRPGGCFVLVDISFPGWLVRGLRLKRFHSPGEMRILFVEAGLHVQTQKKLTWRRLLATAGRK